MRTTKDLRNNTGITLIALVITIIVMLVLVGVTISMAINGGLFGHAGNAAGATEEEKLKEQQLADGNMVNDLMEDYVGNSTAITVSTVKADLDNYLGKIVNYGVVYNDVSANNYGGGKWEIFYADHEHIYLITKGHLADGALRLTDKDGVGYGGTSDFIRNNKIKNYPAVTQGLFDKTYDPALIPNELKYTSDGNNMKATQYLLDSRNWSGFVNGFADWAIGGPTMEMFVNSYNESNLCTTPVELSAPSGYGYSATFYSSGSVAQDTYLNHYTSTNNSPSYYWIACPSITDDLTHNIMRYMNVVLCNKAQMGSYAYDNGGAFRPVVCLNSNVKLTLDKTSGEYNLSWNATTN